ncbi:hypothetical protein [Candidatus Deianiraea vastatrix]|uniref:Uncharacterized protein n=1 Tax=Candidatus Deianiraea vastatrix TaxID=2163644 RepID=A0A5B8XCT2_9RICK|nr:hypothetical protein [Candidatus Deianiraea vastatrix]QED23113.1 hypothetical protein Deia_00306 [Candidatus Deianiraea vastatrix]
MKNFVSKAKKKLHILRKSSKIALIACEVVLKPQKTTRFVYDKVTNFMIIILSLSLLTFACFDIVKIAFNKISFSKREIINIAILGDTDGIISKTLSTFSHNVYQIQVNIYQKANDFIENASNNDIGILSNYHIDIIDQKNIFFPYQRSEFNMQSLLIKKSINKATITWISMCSIKNGILSHFNDDFEEDKLKETIMIGELRQFTNSSKLNVIANHLSNLCLKI